MEKLPHFHKLHTFTEKLGSDQDAMKKLIREAKTPANGCNFCIFSLNRKQLKTFAIYLPTRIFL